MRITIELDSPTVDVGGSLTGRVNVFALRDAGKEAIEVELGPTVDTLVQVAGRNQPQQRARYKASSRLPAAEAQPLRAGEQLELPFRIDLRDGVPPTLHNGGKTSIVWQLRVTRGKATGWHLVGVLDPDASAGTRNQASPSLLSFLGSLDSRPVSQDGDMLKPALVVIASGSCCRPRRSPRRRRTPRRPTPCCRSTRR